MNGNDRLFGGAKLAPIRPLSNATSTVQIVGAQRAPSIPAGGALTLAQANLIFAPISHTHPISAIDGLTTALAAKQDTILPGTTGQFRRGDNSWSNTLEGPLTVQNLAISMDAGMNLMFLDSPLHWKIAITSGKSRLLLGDVANETGSGGFYFKNSDASYSLLTILVSGMIATVGISAPSFTVPGATLGFLKSNGTIDTSSYLTGNQAITLSGDVTGTGTTSISTSIAPTTVTGKALTGYTLGSNSTIAPSDTILGALGKLQAQTSAREPSIAGGTTAQFWRGDKTWSNTLAGPLYSTGIAVGSISRSPDTNIVAWITGSAVTNLRVFSNSSANSAGIDFQTTSLASSSWNLSKIDNGLDSSLFPVGSLAIEDSRATPGQLTRLPLVIQSGDAGIIGLTRRIYVARPVDNSAQYIGNWPGSGYWGIGTDGTSSQTLKIGHVSSSMSGTWGGGAFTLAVLGSVQATAVTVGGLPVLTGNQAITLSGDVTGTGATSISTSIAPATVTGKAITGYALGSNTTLAPSDTILGALGKLQAQISAREPSIAGGTTAQFWRGDKTWSNTLVGTLNASGLAITGSGSFSSTLSVSAQISTTSGISVSGNYGSCGLFVGTADNATLSQYNLKVKSWWGIGFESYDGITRTLLDTRTGNLTTQGQVVSDSISTNGINLNGSLSFANSGTSIRGISGTVGDNDLWRMVGGATASDSGYLEIATADNGNEPIFVRQYTGNFATQARTLTLLDANGNTSVPGSLTAIGDIYSYGSIQANVGLSAFGIVQANAGISIPQGQYLSLGSAVVSGGGSSVGLYGNGRPWCISNDSFTYNAGTNYSACFAQAIYVGSAGGNSLFNGTIRTYGGITSTASIQSDVSIQVGGPSARMEWLPPQLYSANSTLPTLGIGQALLLIGDQGPGQSAYWQTNGNQRIRYRDAGAWKTTAASTLMDIPCNERTMILIGPTSSTSNLCSVYL